MKNLIYILILTALISTPSIALKDIPNIEKLGPEYQIWLDKNTGPGIDLKNNELRDNNKTE